MDFDAQLRSMLADAEVKAPRRVWKGVSARLDADAAPVARPWGWVSILGAVYEDFYKVLENKRPESPKQNAIWTSPVRNALSSKNPANAETEQKALLYKKAADIADSKDRLPGLMLYFMALKKKLKR